MKPGTKVWVPALLRWCTVGEEIVIDGVRHWRLNEVGGFAQRNEIFTQSECNILKI